MKRPAYRTAIKWIAINDDTQWLHDDEPIISVTAALIIDLFDVDEHRFIRDLRKEIGDA